MYTVNQRSKKTGLSPGTVMYTGDATLEPIQLNLIQYDQDGYYEDADLDLETALKKLESDKVNWLNITGVHDVMVIERLGQALEVHPLTLEDIASVGQRPKLESYDHYLFIVLRMLDLDADAELENEQVSIVLKDNMLITFQETPGDVFDAVRNRLRQGKGRIRQAGADYLAYALIDGLVDSYFSLLERYSDEIEDLEDVIFENPRPEDLHKVNSLKHDTLFIRKAIWPLREVIGALQREESRHFSASVLTYVRDVYDHSVQIIDTVETLRDVLSSLQEVYLSSLSYRMNEVMKVLTIISTIFIPLSFLVGVYGMNFDRMPELHWPWAYPVLWLIMIGVAILMLLYFRRKRWL